MFSSNNYVNSDKVFEENRSGTFTFLLNQSAFEIWVAGGVSSVSGTVGINYDVNYFKDDWSWDNKIIASFGITKIKDQDTQKSDDRLEWNSVLGKKASGYWYYSGFINFKTQFTDDLDSDTEGPTKFLSPGYLQIGPGMLWKKSENLKVNIAPTTSKLIVVDKNLTLPNAAYFGVEEGKSTRFEFGASIGAYYKFDLMKNISMENILNLYSNYLEDPQNVDLDYTMNLVMNINKYISTTLVEMPSSRRETPSSAQTASNGRPKILQSEGLFCVALGTVSGG